MDMYNFVWICFPDNTKWLSGAGFGRANSQGAFLAFDLNVSGQAHPPQAAQYAYDWDRDHGPSGPWCAAPPGRYDRRGLHPETRLINNLGIYIEQYRKAHHAYPQSVSIYTFFGPCEDCAKTLRAASFTYQHQIASWYLYFDQPHIKSEADLRNQRKNDQRQLSSKPRRRNTRGKYENFDAHYSRLSNMGKWNVDTF